jgi:hypothetical protein
MPMRGSATEVAADAIFDNAYRVRIVTVSLIVMNKRASPKALYAGQ